MPTGRWPRPIRPCPPSLRRPEPAARQYAGRVEWLVVAVLAVFLLGTSLLCLVTLIARQRVQRRHRVDPAVPTEAPLTWMIDPRAPARLHRRLARVGDTATAVATDHQPRRRLRRPTEPSPLALVKINWLSEETASPLMPDIKPFSWPAKC